MAGKRKPPKLRNKDGCFVTDIYKPSGKRTTISFGSPGQRTEGEIYAAFGHWLDLFNQHPHKVLTFESPYDAIAQVINHRSIVTVGQLFDKYLQWIRQYLPPRREGLPHPDLERLQRLGKFLAPYRPWPVGEFGPDELRAVQTAMVEHRYFRSKKDKKDSDPIGYTRAGINVVMKQIHKMWQWAIGREIATQAQAQRLKEVRSLRPGQTSAKDNLKRALVTQEEFAAVTGHLTTVVADMLRLIWLTAMRPGEICHMRPFDIVREDPNCWIYIPGRDSGPMGDHKTAYRRRIRAIPLTLGAQEILKPRIKDYESKECIFQPIQAIEEMRDRRFAHRVTPLSQGNRTGTNRKPHPMINPGKRYGKNSLNNAVMRGCERAGVTRFTPYDLRRSAATRVRSTLGKEAAKLLLGHVSTGTTDIYLLNEVQETIRVAKDLDSMDRT